MEFTDLNLHPDLLKGIAEAGYVTCMPVQEQVFVHAFKGEDIYAQSQTGTGKTAAFLVTIFQRMLSESSVRAKKSLILAPTRELAVQTYEEARKIGKYLPFECGSFFGGVGYGPQIEMLRDNVQLIIGTPGRIIDLAQQGKMLLRDVGFLVIDEADRMFDMGFIDDLRKLLRFLPPPSERQTMLWSATLNVRVKNLAWDYMTSPKEIVIEPEKVTVELVVQELYHVGTDEKMRLLLSLIAKEKPESVIIFCNLKRIAEEIAKRLRINGVECEYIMGDLPQPKRLKIIEDLKAGKLKVLVATDVAARGLDIEDLAMVVNYDLPLEPENYVHRIGRTARAGKKGKAVSFACEKFVYGLSAIEKYIDMKIPVSAIDDGLLPEDKSVGIRFYHERKERPDRSGRGGPRYGESQGRERSPHFKSGGRPQVERRGRDDRKRPEGISSVQRSIMEAAGATALEAAGASQGKDQVRKDNFERSGKPQRREDRPKKPPLRQEQRPSEASRKEREIRGELKNPYALPIEERMKIYREKYGAGPSEKRPADAERSAAKKGRDERKGSRPQGNQGPRPRDGSPRGGSQAPSRGGRTGIAPGQGGRETKPAAKETDSASGKKGILGSILGFFRKK